MRRNLCSGHKWWWCRWPRRISPSQSLSKVSFWSINISIASKLKCICAQVATGNGFLPFFTFSTGTSDSRGHLFSLLSTLNLHCDCSSWKVNSTDTNIQVHWTVARWEGYNWSKKNDQFSVGCPFIQGNGPTGPRHWKSSQRNWIFRPTIQFKRLLPSLGRRSLEVRHCHH